MPELVPIDYDPFNDRFIPVDHDPFDPLAASAGVAPAGTPRIDQIDWGQPSWAQQAAAQSQRDREAYARGGVPEMMRDTAATQDLAGGFGGGGIAGMTKGAGGIRAYHGSPHDFERFDMSKIGTGEGAQAYGHGLYFAENEGVAKSYKTAGSAYPSKQAFQWWNKGGQDWSSALEKFDEAAARGAPNTQPELRAEIARNAQLGKTYEVNIAADPEHFLDWDKKVRDMPPVVQEKLKAAGWNTEGPDQGLIGSQIYKAAEDRAHAKGLTSSYTDEALHATQMLREAGIPGIKYLDQGSRMPAMRAQADIGRWQAAVDNAERVLGDAKARGAQNMGEYEAEVQRARTGLANAQQQSVGTSNYVVFDDKLIDIIKKYGLAGLIAGGAAHFSTQQVDHDPFATQ